MRDCPCSGSPCTRLAASKARRRAACGCHRRDQDAVLSGAYPLALHGWRKPHIQPHVDAHLCAGGYVHVAPITSSASSTLLTIYTGANSSKRNSHICSSGVSLRWLGGLEPSLTSRTCHAPRNATSKSGQPSPTLASD